MYRTLVPHLNHTLVPHTYASYIKALMYTLLSRNRIQLFYISNNFYAVKALIFKRHSRRAVGTIPAPFQASYQHRFSRLFASARNALGRAVRSTVSGVFSRRQEAPLEAPFRRCSQHRSGVFRSSGKSPMRPYLPMMLVAGEHPWGSSYPLMQAAPKLGVLQVLEGCHPKVSMWYSQCQCRTRKSWRAWRCQCWCNPCGWHQNRRLEVSVANDI